SAPYAWGVSDAIAWDGGEYIYAAPGGANNSGNSLNYNTNYFLRYNISNNVWDEVRPLPGNVASHTVGTTGNASLPMARAGDYIFYMTNNGTFWRYRHYAPTPNIVAILGYTDSGKGTPVSANTWQTDGSVYFEWTDYAGAIYYYKYDQNSGTALADTSSADGNVTSPTHAYEKALSAGDYYFHVKPYLSGAAGVERSFRIKYDNSTPNIVGITCKTESTGSAITQNIWQNDGTVYFTWTDPASASDDTFYYEYNTNSGNTIDGSEVTVTSNNYVDNFNLTQGDYYFHARPKNGAQTFGTERVFHIKYDATAPTTITDLAYTSVNSAVSISLSWTSCGDDGFSSWDGYEIYYRAGSEPTTGAYDGIWTKANEANLGTRTTTTATVTGLSANTTYYFKIRGKDSAGNAGTLSTNSCSAKTDETPSYASVWLPGTWDWTNGDATRNRFTTNHLPSGFCKITKSVSVDNEFKITEGDWTNVWASGYWISAYDQIWSLPVDGGNALIKGSPQTYVTVISTTTPDENNTQKFGFLTTSASPVFIVSVSGGSSVKYLNETAPVNVYLSGPKCAQENVWIIYTTDNWATRSKITATGSGSTYSGTIPAQTSCCVVKWYAITTTASDFPATPSEIDYLTLSAETNGGSNYSYLVKGPGNAWHIQDNNSDMGNGDYFLRTSRTNSYTDLKAGDTIQIFNGNYYTGAGNPGDQSACTLYY
ncbi:MAG TPA: fibronectin type III domain-containing protein, partial [bacterium]|nr:fibronectin type III domain-containing protein [bacterium]